MRLFHRAPQITLWAGLCPVNYASPLFSISMPRASIWFCSAASSSPSCFDLHDLPGYLQEEFDVEENKKALRHLLRRRSSPLAVYSSWHQQVAWRCPRCRTSWWARPAERTNLELLGEFGCPGCRRASMQVQGDKSGMPPAGSSSTVTATSSSLLVDEYPDLAVQWDKRRNAHNQNRILCTLPNLHSLSASRVWWKCFRCARSWRESAVGRVKRLTEKRQRSPDATTSFCPQCDAMEPLALSGGKGALIARQRVLADHPYLLSEVRLGPHQDPREIALRSGVILHWHCSYCEYDYQSSVGNRYLHGEHCPQCTGEVETPHNLLAIQRPDVLQDIAATEPKGLLIHLTVHDDAYVHFVCRDCHSPYSMKIRTRCLIPKELPACPKCSLLLSQSITSSPLSKGNISKKKVEKTLRSRTQRIRRLSAATRPHGSLRLAELTLFRKDKSMKN